MGSRTVLLVAAIVMLVLMSVLAGSPVPVEAATLVVDSTADANDDIPGDGVCATSGGQCTLRAAIEEANALAGSDAITLPAGTYTLALAGIGEDSSVTGDLDVTSDLSLNGSGAATTIIDGGAIDRVFHISSGATVAINDVTITNGNTNPGGGIKNDGTLTLTQSTVRDNAGANAGGGIYNFSATLTVIRSTISGNTAFNGGGIINVFGTVSVNNSTISGNTANVAGGGIHNDGTFTIEYSTISNNSANFSTAAFAGGGIENGSGNTLNISNSIVADNPNGGDCATAGLGTSLGHNLDGDGTCGFSATGDQSAATALLGPLQDNGGATFTHALLPGSAAIDNADNSTAPSTDQRGTSRPQGTTSDIGAFELVTGVSVPGVTGWGLLAMAIVMAAFSTRWFRRRAPQEA
jgi:large repetitive protein